MPGYRFHSFIGLLVFFLLSLLFKISFVHILMLFPICLILSVAPDIDHHISKIRKYSIIVISTLILICWLIKPYNLLIPFFVILILIIFFSRHRNWFHTSLAGLIISSPLLYINLKLFIIGFCCYMSHIIIDNIYSKIKRKIQA